MKSLKKILVMFIISFVSMNAVASNSSYLQDNNNKKNHLFVEFLGNAGLYSLNYERMLREDFAARVGIACYGVDIENDGITVSSSLYLFPVTLSYLAGKTEHKFEVGGGLLISNASVSGKVEGLFDERYSSNGIAGTAIVGYRYMPKDGGVTFRAGFTPIFGEYGVLPWFGVSIGYNF